MKSKILTILKELSEQDLDGYFYSLTLNLKDEVPRYTRQTFDVQLVEALVTNYSGEVKSFNLTIHNDYGYNENRYKTYFHDVNLVFYGKGIVFSFTSPYLLNREIEVSNTKKLFEIYKKHKEYSKTLYNCIREK